MYGFRNEKFMTKHNKFRLLFRLKIQNKTKNIIEAKNKSATD